MSRQLRWGAGALAVIGVSFVAIVVVANVRNAVNRRAYETTEWNMMGNGMLLELYRSENGKYPDPGYTGPASEVPSVGVLDALPSSFGASHPWQAYDGWGNPFLYRAELDGLHYALISGGSNDAIDQAIETVVADHHVIDSFGEDVVFKDGSFVRWRQGWCCNPAFQEDDPSVLESTIIKRTGGQAEQ